jgi:hypothetical protein
MFNVLFSSRLFRWESLSRKAIDREHLSDSSEYFVRSAELFET